MLLGLSHATSKLVLVLPDNDPGTLFEELPSYPDFITDADNDYSDLSAVFVKLLHGGHHLEDIDDPRIDFFW
jgi:hypothetical protein